MTFPAVARDRVSEGWSAVKPKSSAVDTRSVNIVVPIAVSAVLLPVVLLGSAYLGYRRLRKKDTRHDIRWQPEIGVPEMDLPQDPARRVA